MKKIREAGVFGAIGFLFSTLLQIGIWKTDIGRQWIYDGGQWLVFVLTPVYALMGSIIMVGYVGFKDKFVGKDDQGNRIYSAFWLVAILLEIIGLLIALEAVLEA
jgi:hypothetical protein